MAVPSAALRLEGQFRELAWVRSALPWYSLVVGGLDKTRADMLGRCLTRIARRGAAVLMTPMSARDVAEAVKGSFDLSLDLFPWLGAAVPDLPWAARQRATLAFLSGFNEAGPFSHFTVSRQPLWFRVGRATKAAVMMQADSDRPVSDQARHAGYHDFRSMDRAMLRVFGVYSRQVRGTVGWEWLLWKFLCLKGEGRELRWDQ